MTSITIEEIRGVKHTVVWHTSVEQDIAEGFAAGKFEKIISHQNCKILTAHDDVVATALPPIPRHPTADDAPLLHLYAAHGLTPVFTREDCLHLQAYERERDFAGAECLELCKKEYNDEYGIIYFSPISSADHITHAIHKRERVEIAISGT